MVTLMVLSLDTVMGMPLMVPPACVNVHSLSLHVVEESLVFIVSFFAVFELGHGGGDGHLGVVAHRSAWMNAMPTYADSDK